MFSETPPATDCIIVPGKHRLERGGVLIDPAVAVEQSMDHSGDAPVVLVFTGLSPGAHICSNQRDPSAGWWEYMVGTGKPIDTTRVRVICVNNVGGCFGSTSPASPNPQTGQVYGKDFPEITLWDIASLTGKALDTLGINEVHCVVGPSMGGMTALAWLLLYPGKTRHMISISAALEAEPFAIALRSLQREIIRNDPDYESSVPCKGMIQARKLGMITYRSAGEWRNRFDRKISNNRFEIENYLQKNAVKFCERFNPESYLRLSQSMDLFSVQEKFAEPVLSFRQSGLISSLVIGVTTDILFPLHQQRTVANLLKQADVETHFREIDCLYGHDAFLVAEAGFSAVIREYFTTIL